MIKGLLSLILVVAIIIGIMYLFSIYANFLAKMAGKSLQKKIDSGKFTDEKLIKSYNSYKNSQKWNKIISIIFSGIFYKSFLKVFETPFHIYKAEMIKRNLPLES